MIKNLLIAQAILGLIAGIGTIIGWAIYRKVTKNLFAFRAGISSNIAQKTLSSLSVSSLA